MRLNIIGNGFDLYHGLPSSYYYFGCFMASNYPEFYEEMSNMYGFPWCKRVGHDEFNVVVSNIFWRTFEEKLGYLNSGWMEGRLIDDLGLECNDPIDLDIPESVNSRVIKEKFCEWIGATVNTRQNFNIIQSRISGNKLHFRDDDHFVNFNYTQTLEEIYNIPFDRIIHIHGECEMDERWGELVVGHGNDEDLRYIENRINEMERDGGYLGYQSQRNRLNEYICEKAILEDLKKDVATLSSKLIRKLRQKTLQVDEIWVWGLSCGPVDQAYIEVLREEYPTAKWVFSCFWPSDRENREYFAKTLGLNMKDCFMLNNPNSNAIQSEIVIANKIIEYEVSK